MWQAWLGLTPPDNWRQGWSQLFWGVGSGLVEHRPKRVQNRSGCRLPNFLGCVLVEPCVLGVMPGSEPSSGCRWCLDRFS